MTDNPAPTCDAVHPLAGVTCQLAPRHDGPHEHRTGVLLKWRDPDDTRSRL